MSLKNLNASKKIHRFLLNKLKDKRTFHIYKKFETLLNIDENFIVAVSGGPDSLALSALTKSYAYETKSKFYYVLVNHNLRVNSSSEASSVKKLLKKHKISLAILNNKKTIKNNLQKQAREVRYNLLTSFCKQKKIFNQLQEVKDINC